MLFGRASQHSTDVELIKKKDIFDPIEDDDDIDWKHNPFDVNSIDDMGETPEPQGIGSRIYRCICH